MKVSDVVIEEVGVGAASKDSSRIELTASTIKDARTASLMAYMKKPEYGPAYIEANDVQFVGVAPQARVQRGSEVIIDSHSVVVEDLNVKQLYETVMARGVR